MRYQHYLLTESHERKSNAIGISQFSNYIIHSLLHPKADTIDDLILCFTIPYADKLGSISKNQFDNFFRVLTYLFIDTLQLSLRLLKKKTQRVFVCLKDNYASLTHDSQCLLYDFFLLTTKRYYWGKNYECKLLLVTEGRNAKHIKQNPSFFVDYTLSLMSGTPRKFYNVSRSLNELLYRYNKKSRYNKQ